MNQSKFSLLIFFRTECFELLNILLQNVLTLTLLQLGSEVDSSQSGPREGLRTKLQPEAHSERGERGAKTPKYLVFRGSEKVRKAYGFRNSPQISKKPPKMAEIIYKRT